MKKTKFIFVTGGVYSSLGKGITASSIGRILKELGFKVAMQKLDPYLNIDPNYISPSQHGEVFITQDGAEADLDLGNYERFIGFNLNKYSTATSGKIYKEILDNERQGLYNGKTVQIIPHVTGAIISKIELLAKTTKADFCIIEIGGTVGDIESLSFIEAINEFGYKHDYKNVLYIHCVPLISIPTVIGELKTKPAQHSVKILRSLGVKFDLLMVRSSYPVYESTINKLSWTCSIKKENIFVCPDVESTYFLPEELYKQGIQKSILQHFKIKKNNDNFKNWLSFTDQIKTKNKKPIRIGIISEYYELHDAYFSTIASIKLSCYELGYEPNISVININDLITVNDYKKIIQDLDAIILCSTDSEIAKQNNINLMKWLANQSIPVLVYGYGFEDFIISQIDKQLLSKHKLYGTKNALFIEQKDWILGGVDIYPIGNRLIEIYKTSQINERCRYKYQFNNNYINLINNSNVEIIGKDKFGNIIFAQIKNHPFFIATYSNPEFNSKPLNPSKLYISWLNAIKRN